MNRFALFLLLVSGTGILSCKKDDFVDPNRGRSYLHIISASENKDTFQLTFNYYNVSNVVIGNFYFNRNWPLDGYADLEEGGVPDEYGNGQLNIYGIKPSTQHLVPDDTVLRNRTMILGKAEKSTLCFADSSGEVAMVKLLDVFTQPDTGKVSVRFINLHENFSITSLESSNNTNINLPAITFLNASAFATVNSGTYDFTVSDDGSGSPIGTASGLVLESGQVYSFFFAKDNGTPVLRHFRH